VLRQLERYGVDTVHVRKAQAYYRNSLAVIEQRFENCQNVIYRSNAADLEMSKEQIAEVDFSQFGALVMTGTALSAEPSSSACLAALDKAEAAGIPMMIDIDYRANAWRSPDIARSVCLPVAARCGVVVANDEEFGVLAGGVADGLELARKLGAAADKFVVYKMGEKGSIAFTSDQETRHGIYRIDALKPTGAGDAFMAGLLASIAHGHGIADAISRGSAAAAIVVSRFGCAPAEPKATELDEFLRRHQPEMA
jgi:5-dehydro-2-deoxygluconokinase